MCPGCEWVAFVQWCQCQCLERGFTITSLCADNWYGKNDFRFEDKRCPVVRKYFTLFWSRCKDSDCYLYCSFKTWLRVVLFNLFLVKSWRRLCSGWSGILFTFSSVSEIVLLSVLIEILKHANTMHTFMCHPIVFKCINYNLLSFFITCQTIAHCHS